MIPRSSRAAETKHELRSPCAAPSLQKEQIPPDMESHLPQDNVLCSWLNVKTKPLTKLAPQVR
jgi:hypothetical protein